MTPNPHCNVYIASCTENGGIYRYHLTNDGKLVFADKCTLDRPMYMAVDNGKMYVVLRSPFEDNTDSGVVTLDISADGSLTNKSEIISTKGVVACHIAVIAGSVYCANYISGSVIKLPDILVQHHGKGVHPTRQDAPHAHFVGVTPDGKYVCAVDLGVDTVFIYDKSLNLISKATVPQGHGARHIAFSDDGRYMFAANELASTVSAFSYSDGSLEVIDTVSVLPEDFDGESTSAAIRFYKGNVYVSNRGHDSVSQISFDGIRLRLERTVPCGGKSPRDFNFIDDFMICTNENSGNVTVYDCQKEFAKVGEAKLEKPLCIL